MEGARAKGINEKKAAQDLRADGVLRRLRLQQVALDRLRVPRLPDGVSQGELPVALRGGAADDRGAEHRQAGHVPGRGRDRGVPVLPPDINESQLHFSVEPGQRRPLRPHGHQGARRRRDQRRSSTRARAARRPDHVAARAVRDPRSADGQQARVRGAGQGRRLRFAVPSDAERDPTRWRRRRGPRLRAPGCSPRSTAPASTAAARSATRTWDRRDLFGGGDDAARRPRPRCRCRTCRPGPRSSSSTSRRKRSACSGAAIRSIATPRTSRAFGAKTIADLARSEETGRRRRDERRTVAAAARSTAPRTAGGARAVAAWPKTSRSAASSRACAR